MKLAFLVPLVICHEQVEDHVHDHKPSTMNFLKSLYARMDKNKNGKLDEADKQQNSPSHVMPGGMMMRGRMMGSRGGSDALREAMLASETEDNDAEDQAAANFIDINRDDENGDGNVDFDEFVANAFDNESLMLPLAFRFVNHCGGLFTTLIKSENMSSKMFGQTEKQIVSLLVCGRQSSAYFVQKAGNEISRFNRGGLLACIFMFSF